MKKEKNKGGRPKNPDKKVKISPSVTPKFKRDFSAYAKQIDEAQGEIITRLVNAEIEKGERQCGR